MTMWFDCIYVVWIVGLIVIYLPLWYFLYHCW